MFHTLLSSASALHGKIPKFPRSNDHYTLTISAHASDEQFLDSSQNSMPRDFAALQQPLAFVGWENVVRHAEHLLKDCMRSCDDIEVSTCRLELDQNFRSVFQASQLRFPHTQKRSQSRRLRQGSAWRPILLRPAGSECWCWGVEEVYRTCYVDCRVVGIVAVPWCRVGLCAGPVGILLRVRFWPGKASSA